MAARGGGAGRAGAACGLGEVPGGWLAETPGMEMVFMASVASWRVDWPSCREDGFHCHTVGPTISCAVD